MNIFCPHLQYCIVEFTRWMFHVALHFFFFAKGFEYIVFFPWSILVSVLIDACKSIIDVYFIAKNFNKKDGLFVENKHSLNNQ